MCSTLIVDFTTAVSPPTAPEMSMNARSSSFVSEVKAILCDVVMCNVGMFLLENIFHVFLWTQVILVNVWYVLQSTCQLLALSQLYYMHTPKFPCVSISQIDKKPKSSTVNVPVGSQQGTAELIIVASKRGQVVESSQIVLVLLYVSLIA